MVCLKPLAVVMLEMVSGNDAEVFVSVTVFAVLVVPICWLPKARVEGESCIAPWTRMPEPDNATV